MKFEFVEFYPITDKNRGTLNENALGTLHVYFCDASLDLRGIRVSRTKKGLFFFTPHCHDKDHETGDAVKYPIFRFTTEKDHKQFLDFLYKECGPRILKALGTTTKGQGLIQTAQISTKNENTYHTSGYGVKLKKTAKE